MQSTSFIKSENFYVNVGSIDIYFSQIYKLRFEQDREKRNLEAGLRQNRISPSAPVWVIPVNSTSISEVILSQTNSDKDLPSYNEFTAPSALGGDLPPNYFDISIVPNGAVLHYNEVVPYTEASKAKIERKKESVLSLDPSIDKNPDQLWLYFMTYLNEKPRPLVNIHGYHVEVKNIC